MGESRDQAAAPLDEVGWTLLEALQRDGRLSYTELARLVGLSGPAVADRVRRLEAAGLITGYRAEVDRARLGFRFWAFVRIRAFPGRDAAIEAHAAATPEVVECHEVTGEDSYVLKVGATTVQHLDRVITALAPFGATQSTLLLSTKIAGKPVRRPGS
ncbi:MAG TPA: Lrp/AsnC family transcriptional regulator [Azospirillaceae bacterium]|nr:Lrp/AsnC family transcriptional regulator [Azospirillaceae bacterium]